MKLKTEKAKAWKAFSLYVRTKECIATTGDHRRGRCITCGAVLPIGELQAGHFVDGRSNHVLYDERGVHIQCRSCNVWRHGAKLEYYQWMERNQGRAVIAELMEKRTVRMTAADHAAKRSEYEHKYKELMRRYHGEV